MPIRRVDYVDQPFYRPRHTPDVSKLAALYTGMGDALAASRLQANEATQRGLFALGRLYTNYQDTKREQAAMSAAATRRQQERAEDRSFTESQSKLERDERAAERAAARAERTTERAEDATMRANERAENAVSEAIDKAPRGLVSPVLFQAAQKFPNQAARFVVQDGVAMLPMTGAEKQAFERDKQMNADRKEDNARMATQIAEAGRHNRAMEAAATTKQTEPQFYIRDGQVIRLADNEIRAGDIPYSASAMQGRAGESADVRTKRTAAALNAIDMLKSVTPKRVEGFPGILQGGWEKAKGLAGFNTQARQYEALLGPTAMLMAVAVQGAAGLSNSEREAMAGMLGSIDKMDYPSQLALLDKASQIVGAGEDVQRVTVKDPTTGQTVERWAPTTRSRPGVAFNPAPVTIDVPAPAPAMIEAIDPQGGIHHAPAGTPLPPGWRLKQ